MIYELFIIKKIEKLDNGDDRVIVDMGCGKARLSKHFEDKEHLVFHNFDHVAIDDTVVVKDISDTGLENESVECVVLCLAMWGSNCKDHVREAHMILKRGGELFIAEAYSRWVDEDENRLKKLLEDNDFIIRKIEEEKFLYITGIK